MKKLWKRIVIALTILAMWTTAMADAPEATPEIIVVSIAATPTPTPISAPPTPVPTETPDCRATYEWPDALVDGLAAIYWETCNTAAEKLAVTAVIYNRAAHGSPFADTPEGAATQRGEFRTGRISDRNRAAARRNLDMLQAQRDGFGTWCDVPESALYVDRIDGVMVLLDARWNVVWRCA